MKRALRKHLGATLLEMILVIGISSIILVSVGNLVRVGVDYYFYSTAQLEIQRNSLLCLSILTQELTASTYDSLYTENKPADPNAGLVFAISDDGNEKPLRDGLGNLLWTDLVCYYVGEIDGKPVLMRKQDTLSTPFSNNPPLPGVPTGDGGLGLDIDHFVSLPDPGRLMTRGISNMITDKQTDALKITMTAEIKEGRNWLEMDIETTIVPRN